jgi:phospholipid/cholesterol/gamma-HCH transport system permease protein
MGEVRWDLRQQPGRAVPDVRWALSGAIGAGDAPALAAAGRAYRAARSGRRTPPDLILDLTAVSDVAELGRVAIVEQLERARSAGARVLFAPRRCAWRRPLGELWVHLRRLRRAGEGPGATRLTGFVEALGAAAMGGAAELRQALRFAGAAAAWTFRAAALRRARLWLYWDVALRAGSDAIPILTVLSFLIGVVLADQAARQLQAFGAAAWVSNLVAIAFVREMGPLLTAILAAGRTGSAFTASLASMQDSEELAALQMMGHHPMGYLVAPRLLAAVTVMPVLVLWSNFVGLFGAFCYSTARLDAGVLQYWTRTLDSVGGWDLSLALLKSLTFGVIVALVGCYKGLQEVRGADEVGRQTTASVVWCIFLVIVASSFWTVLFSALGR